jgi:hypothetical protein
MIISGRCAALLQHWDASGTQRLSLNELKTGMMKLGALKAAKLSEAVVEQLFRAADTRQEGWLTRSAFLRFFEPEVLGGRGGSAGPRTLGASAGQEGEPSVSMLGIGPC